MGVTPQTKGRMILHPSHCESLARWCQTFWYPAALRGAQELWE